MNRKEYQKNWVKTKRLSTNTNVDTKNVDTVSTPLYDHDLTAREIMALHSQRTQDQIDRFPNIPLPFGQAYYKTLSEQRVKHT